MSCFVSGICDSKALHQNVITLLFMNLSVFPFQFSSLVSLAFLVMDSWLVFYVSNTWRTTSEEKRELERLEKPMYNSVRRAAEVHRQVAFFSLFKCFAPL